MLSRYNRIILICLFALLFYNSACEKAAVDQSSPPTPPDQEQLTAALESRNEDNPQPLTMLQGYQIAQNRATEWDKNSYLILMIGSVSDETAPLNFWFRAPNKKILGCFGEEYKDLSIDIDRHTGNVVSFEPGGYAGLGGWIDPRAWRIDSPEALEIADRIGGASFISQFEDCYVSISADGWVGAELWFVVYREKTNGNKKSEVFRVSIDPYTGDWFVPEDTTGILQESIP